MTKTSGRCCLQSRHAETTDYVHLTRTRPKTPCFIEIKPQGSGRWGTNFSSGSGYVARFRTSLQ